MGNVSSPATDFVIFAGKGQLEEMKKMVAEGLPVDSQDDGRTALMAAASQDKQDVVKWLLQSKARLELCDKDGWTALMIASFCGNIGIIKLLLAAGAKVDALNPLNGWTALMKAASYGEADVCNYLVDQAHANLNIQGRDGKTALMLTAWKGNVELASHLLKKGAKVDLQTDQGWTALMVAAFCDRLPLVELFMEHSARLNTLNVDHRTALMEAASRGNLDVVEYLVNHGADLNVLSQDGLNALTEAAVAGKLDVVEYLVGKGCDMENSQGIIFDIADKEALAAAIKRGMAARGDDGDEHHSKDANAAAAVAVAVTGKARPEEVSIAIVGSTHVQIGDKHFEFKSGDPLTKVFGKEAQLLDVRGKLIKTKKDQGLHIPQALQPGRILVINGKRYALQVVLGVTQKPDKFGENDAKHGGVDKPVVGGVAELVQMRVPSRFSTGSVGGSISTNHRDSKHVEWSEFNFAYSAERWSVGGSVSGSISQSSLPDPTMFLAEAGGAKHGGAINRRATGFRKGAPVSGDDDDDTAHASHADSTSE